MILPEVLLSEEQILKRVAELGKQIKDDYNGQELVLICALRGGVIFMADLARQLDPLTTQLEFIKVSSYQGQESTGKLVFSGDIAMDIEGLNVLLVEDIIDTGLTIDLLIKHIMAKKPKDLKVCALLNKNKVKHIKIDYNGFDIPNNFVVGYGLDYNGKYRNLPYVGTLPY
ncbi:MAG: hypoxanthine phosphoribosyltransferase [Defluviitaleaceae bacterium]|nr:hypoxanthine phosphoribosyltransferase [Defluviitaleaceae bacterium]